MCSLHMCKCDCLLCHDVFLYMQVFKLFGHRDDYLTIQDFDFDANLRKLILEDILKSEDVLTIWNNLAASIPEKHSICLLKSVANLWITMRGYSFAKGWTDKSKEVQERN